MHAVYIEIALACQILSPAYVCVQINVYIYICVYVYVYNAL